ncbi:ABC transporter family substrate-binding protein [Nonomuraea pusilla]|uniref:ABC transporter family substrate-binding protein n=1 Tax=Nonomuraea pusilla TaxID=46177 RepID=UPI00332DBFD4
MTLRTRAAVTCLLATAPTLTACGGGPGGRGPTPPTPPSAGTNDMNPRPRSALKDGGPLQWGLGQKITNFTYYSIDGAFTDTYDLITALLPRVFHYSASGQPTPNTDYFTKIGATSQDPLTITYDLAPKAKWSDGRPLSWKDFAGLWRANSGRDPAYQIWGTTGYDRISDVREGATPNQVVVTFSRYFADWRSLFDPLVPASLTASPNSFNKGWTGRPEPAAAVRALSTRQLDVGVLVPDVDIYQAAKATPEVTVRTDGSAVFRMFSFNKKDPILADQAVRRAVILGIDRERMARLLVAPIGGSPRPLQNHIFMPNQAGWTMGGDGYFAKDGRTLQLTMAIQSGRTNSANEAQVAQAGLRAAGIKLDIRTVPDNDYFPKYITVGDFQLATWTWNGVPYPVNGSLSMYVHDPRNVQQNYGAGGNDTINRLLSQAVAAQDTGREADLANQADAELWKDASLLPPYQVPQLVAVRSTIANMGAYGFADVQHQNIGFAHD